MATFKCYECTCEIKLTSLYEDVTTSTGSCPTCGGKNWKIKENNKMSNKNVEEKELTVKWLMQEDKIVKFEEINDTFDISGPVAEFDFDRAGVKAGTKVTVKIDKDLGDHGTVVFMAKSKNPGASSSSSAPASSGNGVIKTVKAYGQKYSGSLLFTDNENEWYTCDKSIGVDNLPQYKDQTVEITEGLTSKNKKIVKTIKIVEGRTTSSSSQSNSKNTYTVTGDARQTSIEAQACMNHANITVATLFAGKFDANNQADGTLVKTLIKSIAKENWKIIQELKSNA
jgi:hypothetical protein